MARPVPKNPWARWALDALERATRTFLQGALAVLTVDQFLGTAADWQDALKVAGVAGVFSLLTSFIAKPTGADDSASFLPENTDPPQP